MKYGLAQKASSAFLTLCIMMSLFTAIPVTASAEGFTFDTIVGGFDFGLAIKSDETLWAWGNNSAGQIGNGKGKEDVFEPGKGWIRTMESKPVQIMTNVKLVYAYGNSCYAIKTDNTLWAWGQNGGALGDGTKENRLSPVQIMSDVVSVTGGVTHFEGVVTEGGWIEFTPYYSTFALKRDGSLWGWGSNLYGEIGDGTTQERLKPVKIMDKVAAVCTTNGTFSITEGHSSTYAIKSDNTLWSWGSNVFGQLGNGTNMSSHSPIKIMEEVSSVSANGGCASAIKKDGSLWAWGFSYVQRDGYEYADIAHFRGFAAHHYQARLPVKIADNVKSTDIEFGTHTFLKTDNTLWAWGSSIVRADDPGVADFSTGEPVRLADNVAVYCADSGSSLSGGYPVIKIDGSLWEISSNTKIMDDVVICIGYGSVGLNAILKKDGSLWGRGSNTRGEIGQGDTLYKKDFVKIMGGVKLTTTVSKLPTFALTATPTASTVLVNGENLACDAYNIGGNHYFKLRDLAYILSGTQKQFEVSWDSANNTISLTSGQLYTAVGGEMEGKGSGSKTPTSTASKIYLDGEDISFAAYNIEGYNYFKLRDIGQAFDFGVDWDGANNTIVIDTGKGYTAD